MTETNFAPQTIDIKTIKATEGVASVNRWERGDKVRHYVNFAGARRNFRGDQSAKVWLDEADCNLHISLGKGVTSDSVMHTIERLIGCDFCDRRTEAHDYVVLED